jgi:DNA repair protein RecN (Recombination protein N)
MGHADQARMMGLLRLTIDDVGLIPHADVSFAAGFTAFTGETGSGKTMLLGALGAALGDRVERDLVRGERARIVLELAPGPGLRGRLAEFGIELADDDDVVIVREVAAAGRSTARINGVPVSASQLREIGNRIADNVGQGEAQRLLEPAYARELLDRFGGPDLGVLRDEVRTHVEERRRLAAEREDLRGNDERAVAERENARFALAEIDAAGIADDAEDARLRERHAILAHAERIASGLALARAALEDERGAVDALGEGVRALAALGSFGPAFAALAEGAGALQGEVTALAAEIARKADEIEIDPAELEAVSGRLAALESVKRKYGGTLAAVLAARDRYAGLVDADAGRDRRAAALDREIARHEAAMNEAAAALHDRRVAAARRCEKRVVVELRALAMPAARFSVAVEPREEIAVHGGDRIEFRFSANPGEPERPLVRVVSGGERSRVLLAIVVVLADGVDGRAFVFDEIDAGIGGATAAAVGARLGRLARVAQVTCVTHLAQIAVWADAHYALRKQGDDASTVIDVVRLESEDTRRAEVARMLAGSVTPISLEHAAALAAEARTLEKAENGPPAFDRKPRRRKVVP